MKTNASEFARDAQKWDDRELGASEEHVEVVSKAEMTAFNDALSLQAISIRLQKNLIEDLKAIAEIMVSAINLWLETCCNVLCLQKKDKNFKNN